MAFEPERSRRHQNDLDHADSERGEPRPSSDGPDLGGVARADIIQREVSSGSAGFEGGQLEGDIAARIQAERANGQALDPKIKASAEAKFGQDLSVVRVHTGETARELARSVGARAFTSGRDIFVADASLATDESLMHHELTHTIQQGFSETRPSAVGGADTAHEHAAESNAASTDTATTGQVQRYVVKRLGGEPCRISESGASAVMGEEGYSQKVYATDALILDANKKLAASGEKGSYIRLVKTGDDLKSGTKKLHLVKPVFNPEGDAKNKDLETANKGKDEDDTMSLWADCGRSSRAVMGSHGDAAPHATYNKNGKQKDTAAAYNPAQYSDTIYLDAMPGFLKNPEHKKFLKAGVHYNGSDKADLITPTSADQARAQYHELGDEGRRRFDKVVGINTGANPEVGGGYTMNTEYNMPGFKEKARNTWNFHWAGVVMKDGSDNITLENYADGNGYESVNMDWNFQMYGTVKKGQSFQEEHLASNTHGSQASTFAVEAKGD